MTQSLRARLLLGLLSLVVVGLLVSNVLTYAALQSFLLQRLDSEMTNGWRAFPGYLLTGGGPGGGPGGPRGSVLSFGTGTYAALVAPDGSVPRSLSDIRTPSAHPKLPSQLPVSGPDQPVLSTFAGTGGVDRYRVLTVRLDEPDVSGYVLVVGAPMTDIDSTLDRLLILEVLITGAVIALMGAVAWWIVRLGLRPLERMGVTAQAIAAGDLSRRVEPAASSTEIGRLGLALNAMLAQIERAFAERTASEQRLRRFVADASHELRTPLTSIRGYAELMRRRPAPSPSDAALARRRIEEEAIRMSALVNDMLLLARLDQGRPLERASVDLAPIVRDACADAKAMAPDREVSCDAGSSVVVSGDELRIRQVVANLVRNAVVHTPAGTPIELAARREREFGALTVVDHGPGLTSEQRARIFEPFYRADPSRSRDRGGAGLGLSIVAAVAAAHHGRVDVQETPGGGATFRVELPLARDSQPSNGQAAGRPQAAADAGAVGEETKV